MDLKIQSTGYESSIPFFEKTVVLYEKRLREALERIDGLAAFTPDFQPRKELSFYPFKEIEYMPAKEKLRERWIGLIKFRILSRSYFATSPDDSAEFAANIKKERPALQRKSLALESNIIKEILEHPEGFSRQPGRAILQRSTYLL